MVALAEEALGAMPYHLRCTVELHLYLALLFITLSWHHLCRWQRTISSPRASYTVTTCHPKDIYVGI